MADHIEDYDDFAMPSAGSTGGMFPPKPASKPRKPVTYRNTVFPARPIVYGERGEEIEKIQEELCRRGYKIKVDGYYGPETLDALETLGIPTEINQVIYDLILKGHDLTLIPASAYGSAIVKTGRKVRIMAELDKPHTFKIGEILDELDASPLEPERKTGIYVLGGPDEGLSAPIKLAHKFIITDKARPGIKWVDEFEFVGLNPESVLITLLSRMEKLDCWDDLEYLMGWIDKCGSEETNDGYTMEWWAENICRRLGDRKWDHREYVLELLRKCHGITAEKK